MCTPRSSSADSLPQHLQQAPRRRHLTPIEKAEREAIINALNAAGGNKSEAGSPRWVSAGALSGWWSRVAESVGAMSTAAPSYEGHRFPREVIAHAVWLYHQFPLSLRGGADHGGPRDQRHLRDDL